MSAPPYTDAEKLERARELNHALCQPKGTAGARGWRMCIPVHPDDTDIIMSDAIEVGESALRTIATLRAERERLLAFAHRCIEVAREGSDVDGGDVQAWAIEAQLLVPEQRTTHCGEACRCAEFTDEGAPFTCYRDAGEAPASTTTQEA